MVNHQAPIFTFSGTARLCQVDMAFFWRGTPQLPPSPPGFSFSRIRLIRRLIGPQDQCLPLAWIGRWLMYVLLAGNNG